jgi:hypothetical protein
VKRKSISKKTRFDVFKRDGFICQYCGSHPPEVVLHVDHIDPVANGGGNNTDNLVTSCESCNQGKGARLLTAVSPSLKQKSQEVEEREMQILGYQKIMDAKRERIENEQWRVADALIEGSSTDGIRREWIASIKNFIERLGVHDVLDAADIARAAKPWSETQRFKYFCGVCWNKVRG